MRIGVEAIDRVHHSLAGLRFAEQVEVNESVLAELRRDAADADVVRQDVLEAIEELAPREGPLGELRIRELRLRGEKRDVDPLQAIVRQRGAAFFLLRLR